MGSRATGYGPPPLLSAFAHKEGGAFLGGAVTRSQGFCVYFLSVKKSISSTNIHIRVQNYNVSFLFSSELFFYILKKKIITLIRYYLFKESVNAKKDVKLN